jgi:hypothetical protein
VVDIPEVGLMKVQGTQGVPDFLEEALVMEVEVRLMENFLNMFCYY